MSIKKVLFGATLCAVGLLQADVLYWQVGNMNSVKGFDGSSDRDVTWEVARVVYSDSYDTALPLFYEDGGGNLVSIGGNNIAYRDTGGAYDLAVDLSGLSNASSLSFMIELGNYDRGNWTTVATSEIKSYANLVSEGAISVGNQLSTPTVHQAWTGGTYMIPEPTSGLLFLVGGALLALRRRKCA